jgi:hypothetical protein
MSWPFFLCKLWEIVGIITFAQQDKSVCHGDLLMMMSRKCVRYLGTAWSSSSVLAIVEEGRIKEAW